MKVQGAVNDRRSARCHTSPAFVPPELLLSALLHAPGNLLSDMLRSRATAQVCEVRGVEWGAVGRGSAVLGNTALSTGKNELEYVAQRTDSNSFYDNILAASRRNDEAVNQEMSKTTGGQTQTEKVEDVVKELENAGIPRGSQLEELLKNYFTSSGNNNIKPLDHGK